MPSSSNRSTATEIMLLRLWRTSVTRLMAARLYREAGVISDQMASILDMSFDELERELEPTRGADEERFRKEMAILQDVKLSNARMRSTEKVHWAGVALVSAGTWLLQVGRKEEGMKISEWGDALKGVALRASRGEEGLFML